MDNLHTGTNAPIKVKIIVQSQANSVTHTFMGIRDNPDTFIADIPPFNPAIKNGRKSVNKGLPISGKEYVIITFFQFFISFPNEETFKLAIKQIEDNFKVEIYGGDVTPFQATNTTTSFYDTKTCIVENRIQLI